MKILLVTGNYLPGRTGGIENYAHLLAGMLLRRHFEVEVASLHPAEPGDYIHDGIKVNNLRGNFEAFEMLLKNGGFSICHFHEYSGSRGIEIAWFKKAKEYCDKVFFTFHLPYLTCYKGDFRYKGVEDCNTFTNTKRCTTCVIADKIGYKKMGQSELFLSSVEVLMTITGRKKELEKRIILMHKKLDELAATCDNIFIYANWFKKILANNGYDLPTIKKIPYENKSPTDPGAGTSTIKNKILFVGRIQYQKGLHLLCAAMNGLNTKNISLDVYGNITNQEYYDVCVKSYSFNFKGTTGYHHLLEIFKDYDFLVLPSVFTEMFSLVIKDAFYEHLPVIASSAKGNRDAIVDGENGFIFEYDNAKDLAVTIDRAYHLKNTGWKPSFVYPENPAKDIEEIVSYYC